MIRVDLRHQQRNIRVHAMIARIRNHDVPGRGERLLDLGGHRRVHRGEHQLRRARPGFDSETTMSRTYGGISPPKRHVVASRYGFPAERSLAPSQVRSNHGWSRRKLTNPGPPFRWRPEFPLEFVHVIAL